MPLYVCGQNLLSYLPTALSVSLFLPDFLKKIGVQNQRRTKTIFYPIKIARVLHFNQFAENHFANFNRYFIDIFANRQIHIFD